MKYTPTKQQEAILDALQNNNTNPILVKAMAGLDFPFCFCYNYSTKTKG